MKNHIDILIFHTAICAERDIKRSGMRINMSLLNNFFGHLGTILHHKNLVRHYCFKAGLYKQGIMHDWSKYNPVEFFVGVKFYQDGKRSPKHNEASRVLGKALKVCCEILGYQELRVHDLRHAYAALIASYGGDLADIASALGHSNLQMTMPYRGLVRNKLESIVEKI